MRTEKQILQDKLDRMISGKTDSLMQVAEEIATLSSQIDDYIASNDKIVFNRKYHLEDVNVFQGEVGISLTGQTTTTGMHDNAVMQVGEKLDIPSGYLRRIVRGADWEKSLSTHVMNETMRNRKGRYLVRTVNDQVRGFLSDRYRIIDSSEVFITFLILAAQRDFKLVDCHNGEVVQYVEIVRPEIIELETNLNGTIPVVFGARLRSSDFGAGALELQTYVMNVTCLNGLVGESIRRMVHIGAKLPEGINISDDSVKKETAARVSIMKDAVSYVFDDHNIEKVSRKIRKAAAEEVDLMEEVKKLPKLGVMLSEVDKTTGILLKGSEDDGVTGSPTIFKLVSALTAVARDSNAERRRELEVIAGNIIGM